MRVQRLLLLSMACTFINLLPAYSQPDRGESIPDRAREFSGQVVGLDHNNGITVRHHDVLEFVRLHGIDCPDEGQLFSHEVRRFTLHLVLGKTIIVKQYVPDASGTAINEIFLPDGRALTEELVKEGMCWWDWRVEPDDARLETFEREAREARRGLWAEPDPVPPWEWRTARKRYR